MTAEAPAARSARVVWVEDYEDEVFIAQRLLRRSRTFLRLEIYSSGDAFVRAFTAPNGAPPDVVVVDLNLPVMKGIEVLAWIKKQPYFDDTVVGICSGSEDPADERASYDAGAEFFLEKPLSRSCIETLAERFPHLVLAEVEGGRELQVLT